MPARGQWYSARAGATMQAIELRTRRSAWWRAAVRRSLLLMGLLLAGTPAHVAAQALVRESPQVAAVAHPVDVDARALPGVALPDPPADFVDERVGKVRFRFHPHDESVARRLQSRLPGALRKVTAELGASADQALEIRIARGPREMGRLAPKGSPPPAYAVGVAYPALGLVILSVVDPQSWFPPNLADVMTHELSHVVLHRTVGGRPLPLWFVEGLAVHQAGEHRLARVQTLWEAAVVDEIIPAHLLSARFPSRPNQVNLAYAQSADLVEHLLRGQVDKQRLAALLAQVAQGDSFEQALLSAYHIDLPYLEREWRRSLGERYRVLPMLLTGTALWGGIALLAIVAFLRRRKDHREKLHRWAEEEAREDRARAEALAGPVVSTAPTRQEATLFVMAAPRGRDSAIPTIEHEGQRHTLH
jgi:hypothetical protein